MRAAFIQTSPVLGQTGNNLEQAWSLIEKVREADLVVLPELFHSGYAVRNRDEAWALGAGVNEQSEPLELCLDACRQFRLTLVGGFLERDTSEKKLYNSAWMIGQEGVISRYRKVHLFNNEYDIFSPGVTIEPPVRVGTTRVGMQVCFDWIFPENWGRLAWGDNGRNGAQVIAHPVNLVLPGACPLALRTRAMENRIFIVSAGRVGVEPGPGGEIIFQGGSRIIAPDGEILAEGPENTTGYDMVKINPEWADDKFVTPANHVLRERFGKETGNEDLRKVDY